MDVYVLARNAVYILTVIFSIDETMVLKSICLATLAASAAAFAPAPVVSK